MASAHPREKTPVLDFAIEGMTCAGCAARITRALEESPGVSSVAINFAMKSGRVTGAIDEKSIAKVVQIAGYKAVFGQRDLAADLRQERKARNGTLRSMLLAMGIAALVMLLAMGPMLGWFVVPMATSNLIQAILTTIMIAGPARIFFLQAFTLARHRNVNMDTLVAIGVGSAWVYSMWQLVAGDSADPLSRHLYFESAAVIAAFVLMGRWLEERARSSAVDAIMKLAALQPATATVRRDGLGGEGWRDEEIPVDSVRIGDVLVVAAGRACPADGRVIDGESEMDEALVSGESVPVFKKPGDLVTGGTVNCGSGMLLVRTEKTGNDTMLAQILSLVRDAQATRPAIQKLVDAVAARFVPAVIAVAVLTLAVHWLLGDGWDGALRAFLAVLVIACPCALGLATPTAILVGSGRAARLGILVRDPDALHEIEKASVLVIDKTGTVTTGDFEVADAQFDPSLPLEWFAVLAEVQAGSRHPLARAVNRWLLETSRASSVSGLRVTQLREIPGRGLAAKVFFSGNEADVISGNAALMQERGIDPQLQPVWSRPDGWSLDSSSQYSLVWIAIEGKIVARLSLTSTIRPSAVEAVRRIQAENIQIIMASGDRDGPVTAVARATGIGNFHANILPAGKLDLIRQFQGDGKKVIMAGDGINDAPALAQADVGISVGRGTDIAMGTSGLIIPSGDLTRVADAITLSRATSRVIRQNLFWAFGYNVIAIPVAAVGLLSPMIAAGAMALSSVSVVANSLRLNRVRLR
ncbi:MAG: hypothetical protein RIQ81_2112 [Pseudomonadota bacterium]|jgi:Cu+-exporting ATPase